MRADTANYSLDEAEMNRLGYSSSTTSKRRAMPRRSSRRTSRCCDLQHLRQSGEAYVAMGDTAQEIANDRKSLNLNPQNSNATAVLKRLHSTT